jgi:excisionase family DNA binding protein
VNPFPVGGREHPKRAGTASNIESVSLVKADDILTPKELAARLKVPDSWVYEKTRGRCRNTIPCLRLGRYIRFDWTAVATWLTAPQDTTPARPDLPNRRTAASPGPIKTGSKQADRSSAGCQLLSHGALGVIAL